MFAWILCWFLLTFQSSFAQIEQPQILRRFEYKHSFRTPHLAQRDGTIPFWTVTGDAIASGEQLRLAPSMRSKKGLVSFSQFYQKFINQFRLGINVNLWQVITLNLKLFLK